MPGSAAFPFSRIAHCRSYPLLCQWFPGLQIYIDTYGTDVL